MEHSILLDFGSTFTKATVADMKEKTVIFTSKTSSTVSTDASVALELLYGQIKGAIGQTAFDAAAKLATSSAAGGLRMAVIGLTQTLSNVAGRNAAFGAGAKILRSYSGLLTKEDVRELESLDIEMILLCGGYEGGNTTAVLRNVDLLGSMDNRIPIIYAGNSEIIKDVKIKLYLKRKECFVVSNIIPAVGQINSGPTEDLIRNIFLERITNMKGLDKVRDMIDRIVMPTPAAVLKAGELLSRGCEGEEGLGELMIIDIGGATTDIHSYCKPRAFHGAKLVGSPEPYAKRTVEGDLGMRESSGLVIGEVGAGKAAEDLNITEEELESAIVRRLEHIDFLPAEDPQSQVPEMDIDQHIAQYACRVAARRHSGRVEPVCSKVCGRIQKGKNLTQIGLVIGTGGPIIHSSSPRDILKEALSTAQDEKLHYMLPADCRFLLDQDYIFYAAGILSEIEPKAALAIMKNSLKTAE